MDKHDHNRQQLILAVVAREADATHAELVGRAVQSWRRLADGLSPLIGETGFCALYGRSLRLVMGQHDVWIALAPSLSDPPAAAASIGIVLDAMQTQLSMLDAAVLGQANGALLDTFTHLLSGLIGEGLTTRLLNAAWGEAPGEKNIRESGK